MPPKRMSSMYTGSRCFEKEAIGSPPLGMRGKRTKERAFFPPGEEKTACPCLPFLGKGKGLKRKISADADGVSRKEKKRSKEKKERKGILLPYQEKGVEEEEGT